ncbi:zinc dependent phospholipase C family protein [Algoriphagus halophytocola]|uniref:Zinc dependent phospholipase C family protein n=1 Tax=Algoriphagus halophytocola TaxID=2991499 RepID=A0ABY6ML99_9BACT|nr:MULTISPECIES: zinc dependent phospholipase C family protein [unclassified Algoriphagus]UZD24545.1 zinc dependent phospholipase C family protein [Algoriphagus sp. TR-M5]WBL41909.1 zinc dependent phospholipase C family protein [Algoriphagus sp. TR-M9]
MKTFLICLFPIIFLGNQPTHWGFYAHSLINRLAVFSLPVEMITFYKPQIQYITENAVNPDRRRYAVEGEAEKHYIDLDFYGDSALSILPKYWNEAVEKFSEDSLRKNGIGPWSAYFTFLNLTKAFEDKNSPAILRLSADLGHYIGDLNVPLHTTVNYNGQLTDQVGIHGFWESRVPELQAKDYPLWAGQAEYVDDPQQALWDAVAAAHTQVDSVLSIEKELTENFSADQKYSYEERNNLTVRVYSRAFTEAYALALDSQVERQMRKSIKMIADFWFTAWVNAGQPDLSTFDQEPMEEELIVPDSKLKVRDH